MSMVFARALYRISFVAVFAGGLCVASQAAAKEPSRAIIDQREVDKMHAADPEVFGIFEKGESAYANGRLQEALQYFTRAGEKFNETALVFRRKCQVLTALGRRDEAILACGKAVGLVGSAMDLRAMVGARMIGPPPTLQDVALSLMFAERAARMDGTQPWGFAARCDVALQLGDVGLLEDCVAELRRRAPLHYETLRAAAFLPDKQPGWMLWSFWGGLCGVTLLTAACALWKRVTRTAVVAGASVLAGIFALTLSGSSLADDAKSASAPAPALEPNEYPINEADPSSSVPARASSVKNPIGYGYFVMDLTRRADAAIKANDVPTAIKYFKAVAKAVPESAVAFAKLCELFETQGKRAEAISSCDVAVNREGVTLNDFARFSRVILSKEGTLEPALIAKLDSAAAHLQKTDATRADGALLQCELGARLSDPGRLKACTSVLEKSQPQAPQTISYAWALAMSQRDATAADATIARASKAGMPAEAIQVMLEGTEHIRPFWARALRSWRKVVGVLLITSATFAIALVLLRRKAAGLTPSV